MEEEKPKQQKPTSLAKSVMAEVDSSLLQAPTYQDTVSMFNNAPCSKTKEEEQKE